MYGYSIVTVSLLHKYFHQMVSLVILSQLVLPWKASNKNVHLHWYIILGTLLLKITIALHTYTLAIHQFRSKTRAGSLNQQMLPLPMPALPIQKWIFKRLFGSLTAYLETF